MREGEERRKKKEGKASRCFNNLFLLLTEVKEMACGSVLFIIPTSKQHKKGSPPFVSGAELPFVCPACTLYAHSHFGTSRCPIYTQEWHLKANQSYPTLYAFICLLLYVLAPSKVIIAWRALTLWQGAHVVTLQCCPTGKQTTGTIYVYIYVYIHIYHIYIWYIYHIYIYIYGV